MDSHDTADSDEHRMLGRLIKLGLFLLVQGIAVMLVAVVALLTVVLTVRPPALFSETDGKSSPWGKDGGLGNPATFRP